MIEANPVERIQPDLIFLREFFPGKDRPVSKLYRSEKYKWVVISACFLMVFVTLGFCSSTKSLYLAAINEATGIPRSLYSLSDSCRFITTAVINLFFGSLIARFGSKRLIAAGFGCLILFSLIYSRASNVAAFCFGSCFLGLGLSGTNTAMVGHTVNQWWPERRGTVMGFILAANGLGGALAVQIVSPLINREGDPFGYRSAYRLTAVVLAVSAALILAVFREKPYGAETASPAGRKKAAGPSWPGIDLKTALRTRYFYGAAAAVFLTGMTLQAVGGISAAHMKDVGLAPELITGIFSFYSIALALSKVFCGFLYDRLGLRRVLLICECCAIGAMGFLILTAPTPGGKTAACVYGILSAVAMPLETIMLPLITANLFGERAYEKMLGVIISVNTAGYALSTPLMNLCYDLLGTYVPALTALMALMTGVLVIFLFVQRAADRVRSDSASSDRK